MADPYFFGYGSLVNRTTHDYPNPVLAQLSGWRRAWRHTDLHPVAFLTAIPDPTCTIDGLIAPVPQNDWAALDEREWAYDRLDATDVITHALTGNPEIAVYAVPSHRQTDSTDVHPILLSYLDVVVQGYLREFGPDGADRFFATTDDWNTPILNDRHAPQYPRHRVLSTTETRFVDTRLADLSATFVNVGSQAG